MSLDLRDFERDLSDLIRSHFPIVHVVTYEEDRALKSIFAVAEKLDYRTYVWTATRGVVEQTDSRQNAASARHALTNLNLAVEHCEKIAESGRSSLFIFLDPAPFVGEKAAEAVHRRRLREFAINIRTRGYKATCIIVAPSFTIAHELEKEVALADFPLPDRGYIERYVEGFIARVGKSPKVEIEQNPHLVQALVDASVGLTAAEIENCLTKALVDDLSIKSDDIDFIFEEKKQIIRKTGILEYVDTRNLGIEEIGGLEALKRWLATRRRAFSAEAAAYGIRNPKGVLVTGLPGCGKSLSAKCVAASWRMPLIKLDMGKIFSMWIGASEENIRNALKTCEAIAPCVVWIDEIEKGLAHGGRNNGDSGTSMRVFGTLLTWMQEKTAPVFLFATANNIEALPAELLRKGRFDDIFFVDLPNAAERKAIIEIHLGKHKRSPTDCDVTRLVALSGPDHLGPDIALTGAEIEAWVGEAVLASFIRREDGAAAADAGLMPDFEATLGRMVPLSRLRAEPFALMRQWAAEHAISASDHDAATPHHGRLIDL